MFQQLFFSKTTVSAPDQPNLNPFFIKPFFEFENDYTIKCIIKMISIR
jgi:hypothetical protein